MKKVTLVILAMLVSLTAFAQGPPQKVQNFNFNSVSTQAFPVPSGAGYGFYKIKWEVRGSLAACTVSLQGSADNVTFGSTIISNQTCTSDGQTVITSIGSGASSFIRVNVSAITLGLTGSSINVIVSAWNEVLGASSTNASASTMYYGDTGASIKTTDIALVNNVPTATGVTTNTLFTTGAAAAVITSSPANIYGVSCDSGVGTGDSWCELFNSTSATLGSTTVKLGWKIPGGTSPSGGGHDPMPFGSPVPIYFSTGISWGCVTTPGGSTPAPSPCTLTIMWKQ